MIEEKNKIENAELWRYVERHRISIENALQEFLPLAPPQIETKFNEAVHYALFSGGKRLRPILTLLGAELFGATTNTILPAAAAVEFIHTSSLIFDDLPCMDNSPERRGQISLHEKYGEGLAVLVAIGFLNTSYGLVFANHKNIMESAIRAHSEIVECVGAAGMIGGQSVDLALAKGAGDFSKGSEEIETVKNLKTSALMRLALRVGAILASADSEKLAHLSRFAACLGDAYQLSDDLIDLQEDSEIFKETKTLAINQGQTAARLELKNLVEQAKTVLIANFAESEARTCLAQLADYLSVRKS